MQNQTVVITGGSQGIGRAIAIRFAKAGANVVSLNRSEKAGKELVQTLQSIPECNEALFIPVDVSNTKDVQNAIEQILMEYQSIDVLVNNAGIVRDKLMLRMEESDFDDVMATNMKACFNTCKATIRSMIKKRRGKIINISSVVGLLGNAGQANYAASKAAIIGFSRSLAKELASRNITVNVIAPGFIDTAMADSLGEDKKDAIAQQIPLKRLGTPEEVAELAFFLAGPHANYITGSTFTIDGGISLGFSIKN